MFGWVEGLGLVRGVRRGRCGWIGDVWVGGGVDQCMGFTSNVFWMFRICYLVAIFRLEYPNSGARAPSKLVIYIYIYIYSHFSYLDINVLARHF